MVRMIICDDMEDVCFYYKMVLSKVSDFEVVGVAFNKKDAIDLCISEKPDIMLVDMQMDTEKSGIEIIREIKRHGIDTKIIHYIKIFSIGLFLRLKYDKIFLKYK